MDKDVSIQDAQNMEEPVAQVPNAVPLPQEIQELKAQIRKLEAQLHSLQEAEAIEYGKRVRAEEYVQKIRDEASQREKEMDAREDTLTEKEQELIRKEQHLERKTRDVSFREGLLKDRIQQQEQKEKEFEAKKEEKCKDINERLSSLTELKNSIREKELSIESECNAKRMALTSELAEKKAAFEASLVEEKEEYAKTISAEFSQLRQKLDEELTQERMARYNALETELALERKEKQSRIDKEIAVRKEELSCQIRDLDRDKKAFIAEKEAVLRDKEKIEQERDELQRQKSRMDRRKEKLTEKEENLDAEIEERFDSQIKTYCRKIDNANNECARLRELLALTEKENQEFQSMREAYGENPNILLKKIEDLRRENETLEKELADRPSANVQQDLQEAKRINEHLSAEIRDLKDANQSLLCYREQNNTLASERQIALEDNANLRIEIEHLQNSNEKLRDTVKRLSTAEGRSADREERIREIQSGYGDFLARQANSSPFVLDELEWLDNIERRCRQYGISFPKRILYAFHTSLKIADFSTLTILAGVSGTGKSELPKLYAAFGGLNFINVPVQPNWDSQESMLGFFNSIDNRFDAQPLLRFLAECTEKEPYKNYMSIVLLDEMNLAHVEHYFADFLSKLEERRGSVTTPCIEVKLGAGVEPYRLDLRRTILWTGTMNQDETTKSLSDKVLDRGVVINFPRPRKLVGRSIKKGLQSYVSENPGTMLHGKTWTAWLRWDDKNLSPVQMDEINRIKGIVEEINNALEVFGRALGHRVWQSIQFYILNYPTVIAAVKHANGELTTELREAINTAFEDQIVQKIMPKLRGIETRGRARDKLRKIESILEDNGFEKLKDDFDIACEQGYGQFMWSSAKYIEVEDLNEEIETEAIPEETEASETATISAPES